MLRRSWRESHIWSSHYGLADRNPIGVPSRIGTTSIVRDRDPSVWQVGDSREPFPSLTFGLVVGISKDFKDEVTTASREIGLFETCPDFSEMLNIKVSVPIVCGSLPAPLRVRLERDHGDRANQSDHVGREPGNQSICRISLWPK